jgi:hypothetical protein
MSHTKNGSQLIVGKWEAQYAVGTRHGIRCKHGEGRGAHCDRGKDERKQVFHGYFLV